MTFLDSCDGKVAVTLGFFPPLRTRRAIVDRLHAEIIKALQLPDLISRFTGDGAETVGNSPQQFADHVKAERDKWTRVIKQAGIRAD